jgi:RpiB/LacA/LacB family sugar-phosphate isomerase
VAYNLLIPIAGKAQRFLDAGYTAPKPLIMVNNQHMIDHALSCIDLTNAHLIFCVRKDHIQNFSIDEILRKKYGADITIVVVDQVTQGTLCTCLLAEDYINNDTPLWIFTPDIWFAPKFNPNRDGDCVVTFKANSPAHSYIRTDQFGIVQEVAEKEVIGEQANVGIYGFDSGREFVAAAKKMIEQKITVNGEYYIAPIYNLLIANGACITYEEVDSVSVLGTPEDLEFYVKNTLNVFGEKPIALCSDHSGFNAKEIAKSCLQQAGIKYIDFGTYNTRDTDQADFLSQAIRHVKDGICDFCLSFCYSGQAFSIGANKVTGIRSAVIYDLESAILARQHNCANFFSIPAKLVKTEVYMAEIIRLLRESSFQGGRHLTRLKKLENLHGT